MTALRPSDIRNVAVVGHKGAGKTALIETMLVLSKAVPQGVTRDANGHFFDDTPEERSHVATLETRIAPLRWGNVKINLVDTPGDGSASMETRLALNAVDAALVVVSAKDGVQGGTDRVLRWLAESKMPCVVAVTRIDDENARFEDVVAELRQRAKLPIAVITVPEGTGSNLKGVMSVMPRRAWLTSPETPDSKSSDVPKGAGETVSRAREKLVEDVAGTDDTLTERYLTDGDLPDEDVAKGLRAAITQRAAVPVFSVSSARPVGVLGLLDGLVDLVAPPAARETETLEAYVFKTHLDPHTGRASYTRVFAGVLRADSAVINATNDQKERTGQLAEGIGKDAPRLTEAVSGDIIAVTKLKVTRTGDTLSDPNKPKVHEAPGLPPRLFSRAVEVEGKGGEDKLVTALERLCEEDAALSFFHDETTHGLVLAGLGAAHLELALERIKRRAGVECKLGPPRIAYKETIARKVANVEGKQKKQTGGHGQFGVCFIDVEPRPRGDGFEFEDAIVGGVIPRQFIPSVEKGVRSALVRGPLAGYPVVDVKVRLFDGKYHDVDSSDAAFQVAGRRGMRAALTAATPVLLEPVMAVEAMAPTECLGDVISDISSRGGRVLGTDASSDMSVVRATVPLAQLLDYEPRLTAMTRGRGTFTMVFNHYDPCSAQAQARVVAEATPTKEEEDS
jgi:elongation factor G